MAGSSQQLLAGNFSVFPPQAAQLDLDQEQSIPFNFKITDVRDISKRGAGHTFEWELPGTEINNQFFGGLHDINADFSQFNPNIRTQCKYILDGDEILNGYLQLKSIFRNHAGNIRYKVTLYDLTSDFFQRIRGKFLKDLDISKLNHILNIDNVKNSWDTDWDKNHLGVSGAADGDNGGYFYPLLNDDNYIQPRPIEHFQPSIYFKRLLNELVKQAHPNYPAQEYTWSGDLKNDTNFEREGLPYTGDKPTVSEAVANSKKTFVGRGSNIIITAHSFQSGQVSLIVNDIPLDDESTIPFNDDNGLWSGALFTAPATGLYKFDLNIGLDVEVDYAVNTTISGFTPVTKEIVHTCRAAVVVKDLGGNNVNPVTFELFGSHEPYPISFEPGNNAPSISTDQGEFSTYLTDMSAGSKVGAGLNTNLPNATGTLAGAEQDGAIFMQAGWTARLILQVSADAITIQGTNSSGSAGVGINEVRYIVQQGSSFRSQKFKHSYSDGQLLNMADFIDPNLKQKDLLDDLVNRKNCIIYTNPDNENDIVFDFRDEFYDRGPTLDLTQQIDNGTLDEIRPIGELQSEEIVITYKKGDDLYNKDYEQKANGDTYGQQKIQFGNEFVKGTKRIESPFMPTPFIRIPLIILPGTGFPQGYGSFVIVPSIKANEAKTKPRVLYMKKNLLLDDVSIDQDGTVVKFQIEHKDLTGALITETITGYPYAGHYDHPINTTIDINPGSVPFVLAEMPSIAGAPWEPTPNNEYYRRWQNTIEQLAEGRLRKSKAYIKPNQMRFIRNNPNTKIFIENTYYFINKILFEGNQNLRKLATLELITVEGSLNLPLVNNTFNGSYQDEVNTKIPPGNNQNDNPNTKPPIESGNTVGKDNEQINLKGRNNTVGSNTKNVDITGDSNAVQTGAKNVVIQNGNKNYVDANNVTIRNSDNNIVTTDGVTIDGNTIIYNGVAELLFNKVDGGLNELRSPGAISDKNLIGGNEDELADPFAAGNIKKIDSQTGNNKTV
jgi:hypothetical protein